MQTGAPAICLPAKQGSRTKCTHVSADGSTAVLLLFDSSFAIYDARSGKLKCQLMQRGDRDAQRVHSGGVNAVYLTADGSRAVSVSKDATARVWDTSTGQCTLVLQVRVLSAFICAACIQLGSCCHAVQLQLPAHPTDALLHCVPISRHSPAHTLCHHCILSMSAAAGPPPYCCTSSAGP